MENTNVELYASQIGDSAAPLSGNGAAQGRPHKKGLFHKKAAKQPATPKSRGLFHKKAPTGEPAAPGEHGGAQTLAAGKRKRKKKRLLLLVIILIALLGAGFGVYQLFFAEEEAQVITGTTTYGSLNRAIEGSGTTEPLDTQTVTLAGQTAIEAIYVAVGDEIQVGDLLYEQDDSEVDDLISEYNDEINDLQIELNDFYEQLEEAQEAQANLTVTAPFAGRVSEITVEAADDIQSGSKLAMLTNDSVMKLTQYVSYAYQGLVYEGMTAWVSVADEMLLLAGTVTDVIYTNYITGDGTKCFTVEVEVANPGALSEGMTAACWFENGETIYAAEEATLSAASTKTISAAASGEIASVNVSDYQQVSKGQTLFVIESSTYEKKISSLSSSISLTESKIEDYQEKIEDAEESREDYAVKAEIAGTVMEMNLELGELNMRTMMMMSSAVTIYSLDTMVIEVNIDELDVDYLSEGMEVNVYRTSAEVTTEYEAKISYLSYEATASSGVSTFPATIEIYSAGALSSGVSVSWSVSVGDTTEGVLAPVESVQNTSEGYCLFVKSDSRPDNAVTLAGEGDPDVPQGFYAVPVTVGASNSIYIRILSGVEQDAEIFLGYVQTAPINNGTSTVEGGEEETSQFPGGNMQGGQMPDFSGGGMPSGGNMPSGGGMPGGM